MKRFCGFFIVLFFVTTSVADGRKVGLTLSGGGALGFAHVGVLQEQAWELLLAVCMLLV